MLSRFRTHLTFANVASGLSLFLVLSGGTAMAIDGSLPGQNTVGSEDIINGEVIPADIKAESIGSSKIADRQVKNADLSLGASSSNTIADNGVQGIDIKDESLTGADVEDFSLSSHDIGVHYASVGPTGIVLASSKSDLVGTDVGGAGFYVIDFGIGDVTECGATATAMHLNTNGAQATVGFPNESEPNVIRVQTYSGEGGGLDDYGFRVTVVC